MNTIATMCIGCIVLTVIAAGYAIAFYFAKWLFGDSNNPRN